MAREGRSRSHEGPSYKVHNNPHTSIYRYIYIIDNAITQSGKVKQTLLTSQGYSPAMYRKCKTDIAKQGARKDKRYMARGNPNTML